MIYFILKIFIINRIESYLILRSINNFKPINRLFLFNI